MKEEQIRDEMRKISQEVIRLADQYRLPIFSLSVLSKNIEKELEGFMLFAGATITLINRVKIKIKKSKLSEHQKDEIILRLERLKDQHNSLLRQLNT